MQTPAEPHVIAEAMLRDLKRAGLKMTPQRLAIVKLFATDDSHPTAQEIFERLKSDYPTMSFATVYNTLDALVAAGLCEVLRFGAGTEGDGRQGSATRFDPNTSPHHHAVCEKCGAVRDIATGTLAAAPQARERLARLAPGFTVHSVERIYRGLCDSCGKDVGRGSSVRESKQTDTRS